jgi:hypothetical protein
MCALTPAAHPESDKGFSCLSPYSAFSRLQTRLSLAKSGRRFACVPSAPRLRPRDTAALTMSAFRSELGNDQQGVQTEHSAKSSFARVALNDDGGMQRQVMLDLISKDLRRRAEFDATIFGAQFFRRKRRQAAVEAVEMKEASMVATSSLLEQVKKTQLGLRQTVCVFLYVSVLMPCRACERFLSACTAVAQRIFQYHSWCAVCE